MGKTCIHRGHGDADRAIDGVCTQPALQYTLGSKALYESNGPDQRRTCQRREPHDAPHAAQRQTRPLQRVSVHKGQRHGDQRHQRCDPQSVPGCRTHTGCSSELDESCEAPKPLIVSQASDQQGADGCQHENAQHGRAYQQQQGWYMWARSTKCVCTDVWQRPGVHAECGIGRNCSAGMLTRSSAP